MELLIVTDRQTGGVPVTTIDLARGLAELGDHVTLLADPVDGRDLLPSAILAGVEHVPWAGQTSAKGMSQLLQLVASRPWDAVLSSHRGCDIAVHSACTLLRRRHVIAIHGDPAYEAVGTRFARLRTGLWRQAVDRSAALITISQFIAERSHAFFSKLPPVYVVANANARHPPAATPVTLIPGHRPCLIACGRIYDAKQPELLRPLVQALDSLGVVCDARWIGGDGENGQRQASLQADAHAHGLGDRIHFIGHREDPWDALRAGHAFVHFCTFEGFGLAVIEALAAGLPVAAFAAGALPELIHDGRNGVLAQWQADDADASIKNLAARLAPVLQDPVCHAAVAHAALDHSHSFTRAAMAAGYRRALLETA